MKNPNTVPFARKIARNIAPNITLTIALIFAGPILAQHKSEKKLPNTEPMQASPNETLF